MHNNTLEKGTILRGSSYCYEIVKTLGQGTFGITYLASVRMTGPLGTIDTNIKVAIKEFFMRAFNGRSGTTVTTGSTSDLYDYYKHKFAREATNLSKMKHPNIVKVLELFRQNDTIYYSMEYIDGGSLDDYIGNKLRLSESEAIQAIIQIGKAISFMHSKGMLHLDLKPQNIMRKSDGNYILIDFGLSKQYDENGNPESKTEVGKGTQGYAPIEQAYYHDSNDFPVTMDVYALGGILYKMLTGIKPPEASVILNDGFPYEEFERYGISADLKECVAHAMAPRKKDRYQTVDIFIKDIYNNAVLTKQDNKFTDGISSLTDIRPVFLQNGNYKVIRTVNSNSFYNIYEAISMISNRRVVIKEFSCNITEPDFTISSLRNRFINSAKTLLRMHHPGIEQGIDIFEENGTAYYVMEYIEGRTLSVITRESPIPESKALKYICQVAESLSYIHKHNILYLDVKPSNIIIDSSDNAILIDFTSLRQYDDDGFLEEDNCDWNVHTLYSPLEQMKGNGIITFTPATDIYALGATFYKLLTGYTPENAVYLATGEQQLKPIPSYVSESTRIAISSAMELNINKRPQTIEKFLEILNNNEEKNNEQTQIDVMSQTQNESKENCRTNIIETERKPFNENTKCITLIHKHICQTNNEKSVTISYKLCPYSFEICFERSDYANHPFTQKIQMSVSKFKSIIDILSGQKYYDVQNDQILVNEEETDLLKIDVYSSNTPQKQNRQYHITFMVNTSEYESKLEYKSWIKVENTIKKYCPTFTGWITNCESRIKKILTNGYYLENETSNTLLNHRLVNELHIIVVRKGNIFKFVATRTNCTLYVGREYEKLENICHLTNYDIYSFKLILENLINIKLKRHYYKYKWHQSNYKDSVCIRLIQTGTKEINNNIIEEIWKCNTYGDNEGNIKDITFDFLLEKIKSIHGWNLLYDYWTKIKK